MAWPGSLPAYDGWVSEPSGRPPTRRGAPLRATLAALAATLFALVGAGPAAAPAAAAAPDLPLVVRLTGLTVAGADPASPVTVTGTVTNPNPVPVYDVRARAWRSTDEIATVKQVEDALTAAETPTGAMLTEQPAFAVTAPTGTLAPGASGGFTVSGTLEQLGLHRDSSYWVGATVTAASVLDGDWNAYGAARTLATVPGAEPVPVVTVYELATTPARLRPNLFSSDELAGELGAGGRLRRLVDAAAAPGASWVVDPELIDEVADMADGYRVVAGASTVEGAGQQAAASWLAAFRALPAGSGFATLYGRPDVVGALDAQDRDLLARASSAADAALPGVPRVALLQRASIAALGVLGDAGVPVLTTDAASTAPWVAALGARIAVARSLDEPVSSPVLDDGPLTRAAAALALARARGSQIRLVDFSDPQTQPSDALATPAWVRPTGLAELLASTPQEETVSLTPIVATGGLTPELTRRLDALAGNLARYGSAAPTTGYDAVANRLSSAAASEAWLDFPAGRAAYLAGVEARTGVAKIGQGITITSAPNVTLAAATSQFPATITNGLDDPIRVRVVATSQNSARLEVRPSDWVVLQPRDSETVQLTADAAGNGLVPISLRVETASGLVVSRPAEVSVEATNLGLVGWIIVVVSGVVLAASTGRRIVQLRRQGRRP